jgi:hypothetical protein
MIVFKSDIAPEVLATTLSKIVFEPDIPVSKGVPFRADDWITGGREWWELSMNNDTKLDVHENGTFTFRDRYHVKERLARARTCLTELGVEFI